MKTSALISQILIFLLIIYADSESTFIHYGLLALFSSGYLLTLVNTNNYIYHDLKLYPEAIISWPFTIIEIIIFYYYGWYDLMILWPIFSYIDLHITKKHSKEY